MTIERLRADLSEGKYSPADIERTVRSCDRQIRSLKARIADPLPEDDPKDLKKRLAGYEATRKELAGK